MKASIPRPIRLVLSAPILLALTSCAPADKTSLAATTQLESAQRPRSSAPSVSSQTASSPAETAVATHSLSPRQIPNFHIVKPYLLRGAAPTPEGLRALKAMGVQTVIDLRIAPKKVATERKQVAALGMRFVNLPMSGDPPTSEEVRTLLSETTDPAHPLIFVHCQHGADRTGTMIGIYREQVDHWDFDRAYREMRRYGFDPHWRRLTATVRQYAPSSPTR